MRKADVQPIKKTIKTNWYFRAGVVSLLYGISVTITLFLTDGAGGEFIFNSWYQMLTPVPAFIGSQLSGATYIGRQIDAEKEKSKSNSFQKGAIYFGIFLAVAIWGIGFIGVKALDFFAGGILDISLAIIGTTCALLANISSYAGFCGRLGSAIKSHGSFSLTIVKERMPILVGTALGLATSIGLWFLGAAAATTVLGVTGFMSGGIIPALVGVYFIYRYTSAFTTAFDYCNRVHTYCSAYLTSIYSNSEAERAAAKKQMQGRENQHRGAMIGIAIGLTVATAIVIALIVTQPYTIVLVAALGIYVASVGGLGGFFSRIGQMMDGIKRVPVEDSCAENHEPTQNAKASQQRLVSSNSFIGEEIRRNSISYVENKSSGPENKLEEDDVFASSLKQLSPEDKSIETVSPTPLALTKKDKLSAKILVRIKGPTSCASEMRNETSHIKKMIKTN